MQRPQHDLFTAVVGSLLDEGIAVRFRAGGRSMSPTVRDGEYLIVTPIDPAGVVVGDIVLCETRRGPLAHRVVAIESQSDGSPRFTLCGDASRDFDRPVAPPQVRGKITGVERRGRLVSLAIAGGRLGRFALMSALRLRRSILAVRARGPVAALVPAATPR